MTQMNINPPKKHKLAVGNDFFFFFGSVVTTKTKQRKVSGFALWHVDKWLKHSKRTNAKQDIFCFLVRSSSSSCQNNDQPTNNLANNQTKKKFSFDWLSSWLLARLLAGLLAGLLLLLLLLFCGKCSKWHNAQISNGNFSLFFGSAITTHKQRPNTNMENVSDLFLFWPGCCCCCCCCCFFDTKYKPKTSQHPNLIGNFFFIFWFVGHYDDGIQTTTTRPTAGM